MTNVVIMSERNRKPKVINLVQQPKEFYNLEDRYDRIVSVLGGSTQVGQVVNSDIDLIEISRRGLPKSVVATVCRLLNISVEKMSSLIHVSHRTIQRKEDHELLNTYSTEQILEIAEVISRGIKVLGTVENFTDWVHSEVRALDYKKPIDYLDTSFGAQLIKDILGRIERGIYS